MQINRKHLPLLLLLTTLLTFAACSKKKGDANTTPSADTTHTEVVADNANDSTIYGKATDDFGMSTFSMVTEKGDTIHLCRTAEDGTDGKIYGSLTYGNRYALITKDNNTAICVLINLTELDKKLKDYKIQNGQLLVDGDTVAISKYLN